MNRSRSAGCVGAGSWGGMCLLLAAGCVGRAETDVVTYVAVDQEFAQPILRGFDRSTDYETGVVPKFDVESTKTVGLVNEIIAESASPVCDVFWNNEVLHTIRLQRAGLLQPHSFDVPGNFRRDMIASDGTWCGMAARARVLMVNTDLLPDPADWPTKVDDLRNPKWKNRCAMARPLFGTAATHFAVLAQIHGQQPTIDRLAAIRDNANVLSGNKQVALSVSAGRHAWGLTDTDDAIVEKDQDYPVAIIFPDQQSGGDGALMIPNSVAILKNAPHPVAAKLLADYLVTPQTEERLAMGNSAQIPLLGQSDFPSRVLPEEPVRWMRVDFEATAELWDSWIEQLVPMFE